MENLSIEDIVNQVKNAETDPIEQEEIFYSVKDRQIEINSSIPVKIKVSYFPSSQETTAGKFNTIVKTVDGDLAIPQ